RGNRPARSRNPADARVRPRPQAGRGARRQRDRLGGLAGRSVELALPEGDPDRQGHERRADGHRSLPAGSDRPVRRLRGARRRPRPRSEDANAMSARVWARAGAAVFVAAFLQVVIVSSLVIEGGAPDLLLVVVVALGLLRGSIAGATLGF